MGLRHRSAGFVGRLLKVIVTGGGRYIWHCLLLLLSQCGALARIRLHQLFKLLVFCKIHPDKDFYSEMTLLMEN